MNKELGETGSCARSFYNSSFQEGKTYGDEYFAELDYIEVIERIKEGYESDVPEDLEEDLKEG